MSALKENCVRANVGCVEGDSKGVVRIGGCDIVDHGHGKLRVTDKRKIPNRNAVGNPDNVGKAGAQRNVDQHQISSIDRTICKQVE